MRVYSTFQKQIVYLINQKVVDYRRYCLWISAEILTPQLEFRIDGTTRRHVLESDSWSFGPAIQPRNCSQAPPHERLDE